MYRIISNPDDATPIFVADNTADLTNIVADGYNKQGTSALVMYPSMALYILDGSEVWVNV